MKLTDIPTPTAAFFQPARNLPALADMGVTVCAGPEVENASNLAPAALVAGGVAWMTMAAAVGLGVVIKRPWLYGTLPVNVVGFMLTVDEPNSKQIPAAALKPEYDQLRALNPTMPIFLSLAGQNITSANFAKPAELQAMKDYLAICDVVTVDCYPMNANASHYKPTWPADAVAKIRTVSNIPVWVWLENNDQQLNPPKLPDVNRAPTPAEIQQSVDAAVAAGANGIGWFTTCAAGKYGWPNSYLPQVDRNGASMAPQYAVCKAIGLARKPAAPAPVPPPPAPVTRAEFDALRAQCGVLASLVQEFDARLAAAAQVLNPKTA